MNKYDSKRFNLLTKLGLYQALIMLLSFESFNFLDEFKTEMLYFTPSVLLSASYMEKSSEKVPISGFSSLFSIV